MDCTALPCTVKNAVGITVCCMLHSEQFTVHTAQSTVQCLVHRPPRAQSTLCKFVMAIGRKDWGSEIRLQALTHSTDYSGTPLWGFYTSTDVHAV